ncbi:chemotaxis protein CheW [Thiomicrorhabdus arctica]|uniref:chemotaxis protein CheW n=1 Tax=Thiomicrorhabdus arctica TaxID=131540 RepID=UPI0003737561|nr:chemotaxis protein CheW [Thiomicrorhabdus arctica]
MSESKKEFLTFIIGSEEYAVEILRVQEIRGWEKPSPLPNVPSFVKGVVDLRGTVVPIIDLREKFRLNSSFDNTTVIIVVHVITSQGERVVGLVVDAVSDVHVFDLTKLQAAPDISTSVQNQFVLGLATIENTPAEQALAQENAVESRNKSTGRMVILIDIDKLASEGLIESIVADNGGMPTGNG